MLGQNGSERFWIMVEDVEDNYILHHEQLVYPRKKVKAHESTSLTITIPIEDRQVSHNFQLRIISDTWVVEDSVISLSLNNYTLPDQVKSHTDLLPLEPLPLKALQHQPFEELYGFEYFNPVQTQVFFALYNTWDNVLLGAPTSSGKTLCAELAIFRMLKHKPTKKVSNLILKYFYEIFNYSLFSVSTLLH